MQIFIASDHAGFELKEKLKVFLKELGYEMEDKGAFELNPDDDYPDFIALVAEEIALRQAQGDHDAKGIVIGGSGQGEAICANKFKSVRAAVFYGGDKKIISLSREHNDANVLSLGARFLNEEEAKEAVKLWLETPFSKDERHIRRIKMLEANS